MQTAVTYDCGAGAAQDVSAVSVPVATAVPGAQTVETQFVPAVAVVHARTSVFVPVVVSLPGEHTAKV
tara:strand:- start:286 stop:489 length:204 start_codon:yes stop_codon:yes gene_type:complete